MTKRAGCTGTKDDALVVRVNAPVLIVSGHRGRLKRGAIAGATADEIRALALQ